MKKVYGAVHNGVFLGLTTADNREDARVEFKKHTAEGKKSYYDFAIGGKSIVRRIETLDKVFTNVKKKYMKPGAETDKVRNVMRKHRLLRKDKKGDFYKLYPQSENEYRSKDFN